MIVTASGWDYGQYNKKITGATAKVQRIKRTKTEKHRRTASKNRITIRVINMDLTLLFLNNGVGVFFGVLFYRMASNSIDKNTEAVNKLSDVIAKCKK